MSVIFVQGGILVSNPGYVVYGLISNLVELVAQYDNVMTDASKKNGAMLEVHIEAVLLIVYIGKKAV